jgi:SAM-dependent methyltransferase
MSSSSYTLQDQTLMAQAKNYFAWQCRLVTGELGRRVVEIGCGIGNFSGMLLDREAVLALDLEPECVARVQERFGDHANLQVLTCDWGVGDWERRVLPQLTAFRADTCVCLNVLEHIEDDREALRRMSSILQPGGAIVLLVPAFPLLYGPIDKLLGHYRRYTRQSLRDLASAAGLRVATLHYMNAIGFFGWWANAHLFRREVQSEGQIGFFDRYIVPISARLEDGLKPPFGQSLLTVLRRP